MKLKKEILSLQNYFTSLGFNGCYSWFWNCNVGEKAAMLCTASVEEVIDGSLSKIKPIN